MAKHLKEITIKELADWIKKNKHVTWHISTFGKSSDKPGQHRGKYITFRLDTRDMKIFRLELEGMGDSIVVDFRDGGEGNILDELDRRLTEDGK